MCVCVCVEGKGGVSLEVLLRQKKDGPDGLYGFLHEAQGRGDHGFASPGQVCTPLPLQQLLLSLQVLPLLPHLPQLLWHAGIVTFMQHLYRILFYMYLLPVQG